MHLPLCMTSNKILILLSLKAFDKEETDFLLAIFKQN